ncbi:MAG: hypothetical protein KIS85_01255 [Anaerolineales bacterium]|nr:hypothetical protein [Anaerolineales bacterium]
MKKLKANIYYETSYSGATVGALLLPQAAVLVDAPLQPEQGRQWLADLKGAGAVGRRLVVNLDAHPDRTLGVQTLEAQVLAHREVVRQIRRRAAIFKALKQESGAEWEETPGLSGLRWILPRLTFAEQIALNFGPDSLRLEHRPGPNPGASWLVAPEEKVVFVGDTLTLGEPPFLAHADIETWLEQLDALSGRAFKDYTIIAGRGGKAGATDISAMRRLLKDVHGRLQRLAKKKTAEDEIEKLAAKLTEKYRPTVRRQLLFEQRLRHGMLAYFARQFGSGKVRQVA